MNGTLTMTWPLSGSSRPAMSLSVVDLPVPEPPARHTHCSRHPQTEIRRPSRSCIPFRVHIDGKIRAHWQATGGTRCPNRATAWHDFSTDSPTVEQLRHGALFADHSTSETEEFIHLAKRHVLKIIAIAGPDLLDHAHVYVCPHLAGGIELNSG